MPGHLHVVETQCTQRLRQRLRLRRLAVDQADVLRVPGQRALAVMLIRLLDSHARPADPSKLLFDVVPAPIALSALGFHRPGAGAPLVVASIKGQLHRGVRHIAPEPLVELLVVRGLLPRHYVKEASQCFLHTKRTRHLDAPPY